MSHYLGANTQRLLGPLACGLLLTITCMQNGLAAITIANEDTSHPTLIYQGKPMFKFGPMPEAPVFAMKWGSREFRHRAWLDWMVANGLGYGRVYPESGYAWFDHHLDSRIFPFKVVRWMHGHPVVDLTRFNPEYWSNVAHVIRACAERGIVLQMQLYQRVYFESKQSGGGWATNYFNPSNNINDFRVPGEERKGGLLQTMRDFAGDLIGGKKPARDGYGLFQAMAEDTVWADVHRQWVIHILDAIGDNGNVIIDLMNEGAFNKGMTKDWIERTLDVIEAWEKETGNDLQVGMDFDHMYKALRKTGDAKPLEYVLSNPRLDVIIAEGAESHVVPFLAGGHREPMFKDLALEFRARYRKPVVSTNSPSYGAWDDLESLHVYQWYAMMTKVQGAGVYAKQYWSIDFSSPPMQEYAQRSRILSRFFDSLGDYLALEPVSGKIGEAPSKYRLVMASPKEAVVYLYTGAEGEGVAKGKRLALKSLDLPDGTIEIVAVDPRSGDSSRWQGRVEEGTLATELPAFDKDLAVHILSVNETEGHE
jgi:hypothetical protein